MTRVNLVDPEILTDQHLIAERLELTFVLSSCIRSLNSKNGLRVNDRFVLGPGHVSFFHNKMGYIKRRFDILTEEFKRRGFLPRMPWPAVNLPPEVMLDYAPDSIDISIIKGRIRERLLMKSQWYRYKGAALPSTFIDTFYK